KVLGYGFWSLVYRRKADRICDTLNYLVADGGLGGARYGKLREAGTVAWSTPSRMRGPLPALIISVYSVSIMSSLSERPPQLVCVRPAITARSISKKLSSA